MYGYKKHVCTMASECEHILQVPPTANFYQRQILRIRTISLPCEWHHGTALLLRSLKQLRMEQDRQIQQPVFIWHPFSPLKYYWDCMQLLANFAAFFYMPFQVFISCPPVFDLNILFSDAFAFINVITNFQTGYIVENKTIILDYQKIAVHYLKTYCIVDLVGSMPLHILMPVYEDCKYPAHTVMFLVKLLRISSISKQWQNVIGQLQLSYPNYMALKIVVTVILFFHWMTYIHFQVPALCYHTMGKSKKTEPWLARYTISRYERDGEQSLFLKYTTNLYLACGLCIGAGHYLPLDQHTVPELILTSSMGLVGILFLAFILASLLRLALYTRYQSYQFAGKYKQLEYYMEMMRLPKFLVKKIRLFINYKFNEHFFNEEAIMNTINEQIKGDINMYSCKRLIKHAPLFKDMPAALINAIVFNLTKTLYMPGQTVIKYGEPGSSIMFISGGTVAVMDEFGKEVAHLRDGAFFGEEALCQPGTKRSATLIALEITEIFKLEHNQFMECLQPYPRRKRVIEQRKESPPNTQDNIENQS